MFGCIVAGRLVQTNLQRVDENKFTFLLPDADNINHLVLFLLGTIPFQQGFAATVHILLPDRPWKLLGMISNDKPSAIFRLKQPGPKSSSTSSTSYTNSSNMMDADQINNGMMDDSMDSNNTNTNNDATKPKVTATLGISIELISSVMAAIQANAASTQVLTGASQALTVVNPTTPTTTSSSSIQSSLPSSQTPGPAVAAQKLISHLYNHVTSFATSVLPPGSIVLVPSGGPGSAGMMLAQNGAVNASFLPVKAFNDWYSIVLRRSKTDPEFLNKQ